MAKLDGKVALITGAARGQGRSHAISLAEEGVDIIALDICSQIDSVPYPLSTSNDMEETANLVTALGRQIVCSETDVRDGDALKRATDKGVAELGRLDIVLANAGISPISLQSHENVWDDVLAVNLTGAYNTVKCTAPILIDQGIGGSIVLTSSTAGLNGILGTTPGGLAYTASKHGLVGLMRAYANLLAPYNIRVNTIHPTGVSTPMVMNPAIEEYLQQDVMMSQGARNALPVQRIESTDVSKAILWLVSDDARYVTGVTLPIDAGYTNQR